MTQSNQNTTSSNASLAPEPPVPPLNPPLKPPVVVPIPATAPSSKNPVVARPPGWLFQSGNPITPTDWRNSVDSQVLDETKIYKPAAQMSFASNTVQGAPSIVELARALKNDPQLIFEFVYNNIDWEPGIGLQKGAVGCLLDGIGNSFDQSALLIALLRQAGFVANYSLGQIQLSEAQYNDWFGTNSIWASYNYCANLNVPAVYPTWNGSIYQMVISHCWVQVVISGTTYMLDPTIKTYTRKTPVANLGTILGYNATTFLNNAKSGATVDVSGNYVQNMNRTNIRNDLKTMTSNLVSYIKNNAVGSAPAGAATVDDVLGGQAIVPITLPFSYSTTLPYQAPGDVPTIWTGDVPLSYKNTLRVQFPLSSGGWSIDQTFTSDQLAGSRLTLFYNGSLQPVLALNGVTVATGEAQGAGTWNSILLTVVHNGYPVTWYNQQWWQSYIYAGAYYLIGNAWGNLGRGQSNFHVDQLGAKRAAGLAETSEPVMGEKLSVIWFNLVGQGTSVANLINRQMRCRTIYNHQVGIVSFNSGGLNAFATDVGGVSGSSTNLDNDVTKTPINDTVNAMHGVALEAVVLAQTTGIAPGISTTTVLDVASSAGDKIYKATSSNWNTGANIAAALQANGFSATDTNNIYNWYLQYGLTVVMGDKPSRTLGAWSGWADWIYPNTGAFGLINGTYKGGGAQPGPDIQPPPKDPKDTRKPTNTRADPVDKLSGAFLQKNVDMTVGSQSYPYRLSFERSYNSRAANTKTELGLGWTHNHAMSASISNDGFIVLGADTAARAAASIVELYVCLDIIADTTRPISKLVTMSLADAWWIEQLVNNAVSVGFPDGSITFIKQPDGSFTSPPKYPATLSLSAGQYTVTTPQGVKYNFNTSGKIASIVFPYGVTITYTYTSGKLSTVTNGMGRTLTFNYTGTLLTSVSDGTGRSVQFGFDASNNLTSFTNALSDVTTYEYDVPGRMTKFYKPANPLTAFVTNTYDSLGRVKQQANARNQATTFYIAGHRTEILDPLSNKTIDYFDSAGNVVQAIDALGFITKITYDGLNRLQKSVMPEGNSFEWTYDEKHNVLTQTSKPKPGSALANITLTFTYDSTWNKLKTSTDGRAAVTTYSYDPVTSNLLTVTQAAVGGINPQTVYTYNARGQVLTSTDPSGVVVKYTYDVATEVNLVQVHDYNAGLGHLNLTTSYAYDAVGNLTTFTDQDSKVTQFSYNAERLLVQTTSPAPFSYLTQYVYDKNKNEIGLKRQITSTPTWQQYTRTFTVSDKPYTVADPLNKITTFAYDGADRLQSSTDPLSRVMQYTYDPVGRLSTVIDYSNTVCQTNTYSPNGIIASIKDAKNNTTSYTVDGFDRLEKTIYADGSYEQVLSYDNNNNALTYRTRSAKSIVNTYDALNRLSTKAPQGQPVVTHTYDLAGRRKTVSTPVIAGNPSSGTITFNYDTAGRFVQEQYPDGKQVTHVLDSRGNRTRTTWPDGYYMTRTFDELSRLTEIKLNGASTAAVVFAYNQLSQRTSMTFGNGASVTYAPQVNDNVSSIAHAFVGSSVTYSYGFDDAQQVNSVQVSDSAFMWHPAAASISYGASNNMNQYPTVAGTTYSYNTDGCLTSNGTWTYAYDTENHLISAVKTGVSVSYLTDPVHRQTQKTVGSVKSRYIYSEFQRIADYNGVSGALQNRYVYGTGHDEPLIAITAAGVLTYLHADIVGTVAATSSSTGAVVNKNVIGPFGEVGAIAGTTFGFTGQRYDADTGLYYYKHRYYSPVIGRFIQPDPIGFDGGMNLYSYVFNSPLNFTDSMGLRPDIDYATPDEAAIAGFTDPNYVVGNSITDLSGISQANHREYAFFVYRTPDGKYRHTVPFAADAGAVTGEQWSKAADSVPKKNTIVAQAHTHPDKRPFPDFVGATGYETFSPEDIRQQRSTGLTGYLYNAYGRIIKRGPTDKAPTPVKDMSALALPINGPRGVGGEGGGGSDPGPATTHTPSNISPPWNPEGKPIVRDYKPDPGRLC